MKKINFRSTTDFSKQYKTSNDTWSKTEKEIHELLNSYIGKRVEFEFTNFYGATYPVEVWVDSYMFDNGTFSVLLKASDTLPERFFPALSDLGRNLGLEFPITTFC